MTRADSLIVFLAVMTVGALYPLCWNEGTAGSMARIYSRNQLVREAPLWIDKVFEVKGTLGNSTIEVRNGKIRFLRSPCSRHICVKQGWIHLSHEVTACLPNRVFVQISSAARRFDSLNF